MHWDCLRSFKNCLASTSRWSDLTDTGYNLGIRRAFKVPQVTTIYNEIWEWMNHLGCFHPYNDVSYPSSAYHKACENVVGEGEMHVFGNIDLWKKAAQVILIRLPPLRTIHYPNVNIFQIIPKSQCALSIFSVNLYFISNKGTELLFLKLNESKLNLLYFHKLELSWEKQAWNLLVWARLIFKTTFELYTKTSESFEFKSWGL